MSTLTSIESTVNSFYLAFYGRPADPDGLKFWSTHLANSGGNLASITAVFANSEEAQVRFGSDTLGERISEIYGQLFNRAPDAAGLAFWTNAVVQGHATLADVSVAILGGAQGSDDVLSTLRQQAADDFTAQVEASGTLYSGYASIEAARVLVRAVTATATADDLKALVAAAVSFSDTASKNPAVVEAIASGSTLMALFDTTRGTGDPVALAQALADTAKAAAGDPVTLEQLLRGGGMAQVLKVMPANATLKDVVKALAEGGLPAAVEVVYPTTPSTPSTPTPAFSLALKFDTVTHSELDQNPNDNVTNAEKADVTFSYTGRDLRAGQHFQYTLNGGVNWITEGIEVSADANTVVLKDIQLAVMTVLNIEDTPVKTGTTIGLRAVDNNGATTATFVQKITFDGYVAAPDVELANDTSHGLFTNVGDMLTKAGDLDISNIEAGSKVEYRVTNGQVQPPIPYFSIENGNTPVNNNGGWMAEPEYKEGFNSVEVRVTDLAGNQSSRTLNFTLDLTAPSTPAITLHTPVDISTGETTSGKIDVSGLDTSASTAWEYSTDNGATWIDGAINNVSGTGSFTVAGNGVKSVIVRQYDAAGNTSAPSAALEFTVDAPHATMTSVMPSFSATAGAKLVLTSTPTSITAIADKSTLSLDIMSTGSAESTGGSYFDGANFKLTGTTLTLDATPTINLYQLGWTDDTFTTSNGYVSAGSKLFVGGGVATVSLSGFEISKLEMVTAAGFNHSNDSNVNTAFIGQEGIDATIHGGGGNDLIADNGSALTLVFDKLSQGAFDVVLGFDTNTGLVTSDTDKVQITNDTAKLFDDNSNGVLNWGIADTEPYKPAADVEAVYLTTVGPLSTDAVLIGATLKALNLAFNAKDVVAQQDFLILATYEDQSILLSYIEKTGNGKIDAGDLAFLAIFDQGVVNTVDIELIGSLMP